MSIRDLFLEGSRLLPAWRWQWRAAEPRPGKGWQHFCCGFGDPNGSSKLMPKLSQSRWCRETSPRVLKGIPFKGHPCSIWGTSKTSLTAKMPKIMRTNNLFYSSINYPQTCYWQQHTAPCSEEFIIWALQDLTKWCLAVPSSREMTQGIRMGQCLSKLLWVGHCWPQLMQHLGFPL